MTTTQLHEHIYLVDNFLSEKACNSLIAQSEAIGYTHAKIQLSSGKQVVNTSVRNNKRIMYLNEALAVAYWHNVQQCLPATMGTYKAIGLNEMFRFYKYENGEQFKMHRDESYIRNDKECSFYTFLLYLNDDFIGGETEFENLFSIQPKTGSLLLFYHPLRHQGNIIKKGTKYVLRSDIMYKQH